MSKANNEWQDNTPSLKTKFEVIFNDKGIDCHNIRINFWHPSQHPIISFPRSARISQSLVFSVATINPPPKCQFKPVFLAWDATSWLQVLCAVYLLSLNVCCAAGNENCSAVTKTKKNTTLFLGKQNISCYPVLHLHVSIMHLSLHGTIQCYRSLTGEDQWKCGGTGVLGCPSKSI